MKKCVLLLLVWSACDGGGTTTIAIESITPDYGPLSGGTRIVLKGSGFLADGAAPNRVVVGGREAPLAGAIDDTMLEVIIPPGDAPGPVDIVVLNRNGTGTTSGTFHYSTAPEITDVSPADVPFSSTDTRVMITGTGFADEGAGVVQLVVDGAPALDVEVLGDTQIAFTARPGTLLTKADLELVNARGVATRESAYRYAAKPHGGLVAFGDGSANFFLFFDPIENTQATVRRTNTAAISKIRTSVVDANNDYWVLDRQNRWGRLDMTTQTIVDPVNATTQIPAIAIGGTSFYAIEALAMARFGSFDPATAKFTPIGNTTFRCCRGNSGAGLAIDSATGTGYITHIADDFSGMVVRTVDITTGTFAAPVKVANLPQGVFPHVVDQRVFAGTLYAALRDGKIITIDPTSGEIAIVAQSPFSVTALEVVR